MGITVLDAGTIIGVTDALDAHHETSSAALQRALDTDALIVPASVYAEVLVMPIRRDGQAGKDRLDDFLARLPARIEPISAEIAAQAARLRAQYQKLRLPDALVIATAQVLKGTVLTTDREWPIKDQIVVI